MEKVLLGTVVKEIKKIKKDSEKKQQPCHL